MARSFSSSYAWLLRIGLFAALLAILFFLHSRSPSPFSIGEPPRAPAPMSVREMHSQWYESAKNILTAYDHDQDAAKARDQLLALRLPNEDRDAHLSLVLAFQALVDKAPNAEAKLTQARQALRP